MMMGMKECTRMFKECNLRDSNRLASKVDKMLIISKIYEQAEVRTKFVKSKTIYSKINNKAKRKE